MEIRARRRAVRLAVDDEEEGHDVQLYRRPPLESVALQQLEAAALERVRALRVLEAAGAASRPGGAEWRQAALAGLRAAGLTAYWRSARDPGAGREPTEKRARAADRLAHFALRLAYCRSERLRRWFVARELELFRLRFSAMPASGVAAFLAAASLPHRPMPAADRDRMRAELTASTAGCTLAQAETVDFYRVKFSEVPELLRGRRVYVSEGFAYVPAHELVSVVAGHYRAHLSRSLVAASRRLPRIEADERMAPLLKGLHNSYDEAEYESKSLLPIQNVDAVSVQSFPPCMRHLHERLRAAHHLKHGGRLQYGLFLKAAGVTLEDAMKFWRDEFTKSMDGDKFDKTYAYNVRYNYGKEGSKKNYSAYSCAKIIQGNVGPADNHGCPFRHSDVSMLKETLKGYGAAPVDIATMTDLVKKGHYQLACGKFFDSAHGIAAGPGINHPNQYYEESRNFLSGNFKSIVPKTEVESDNPSGNVLTDDTIATEIDEWGEDFDTSLVDADLL